MKFFLKKLLCGVKEAEISPQNREILRNLQNLGVVTKHKNIYYQNSGFIIGDLDISLAQTGYLSPFDEHYKKDIIIEKEHLNGAHLGDIVVCKLLKSKKLKAKVLMCLKSKFSAIVVYTKSFSGTILGVNLKTALAIPLKATQKSLKVLPQGTLLKINALNNDIMDVLGHIDDPSVDEEISLAIYDKHKDFPKICENETVSWMSEIDPTNYPERENLTDLPFCTIDPADAKDFDDAIYFDVQNLTLFVAIADVSYYVMPYSQTDKEAKFRGFSIYFPHKSIPMLPRILSENVCSLKPDENRLAFCFKIILDKEFNIISSHLCEAIIKSIRRFTYDEIDLALQSKKMDNKSLEWFFDLAKITDQIRKIRLKKGFDFSSKDLRMVLDDELNLISTHYETQTKSHEIVEECMLLANKCAAKRIKKGIFRNHDRADITKIHALLEDLSLFGINFSYETNLINLISKIQLKADEIGIRDEVDKLIIKAQKKACYSPQNFGHFGLGFETYTHFTSPIRRYSDLILHRLLKAQLKNDEKMFNYLLLNIDETCENLNVLEREATKVEFDFMDRKFARWANERIGLEFSCFVSSNDKICIATLDDEIKGAQIFINNFSADLLTKIRVKIIQVDIFGAKIFGKVVQKFGDNFNV